MLRSRPGSTLLTKVIHSIHRVLILTVLVVPRALLSHFSHDLNGLGERDGNSHHIRAPSHCDRMMLELLQKLTMF